MGRRTRRVSRRTRRTRRVSRNSRTRRTRRVSRKGGKKVKRSRRTHRRGGASNVEVPQLSGYAFDDKDEEEARFRFMFEKFLVDMFPLSVEVNATGKKKTPAALKMRAQALVDGVKDDFDSVNDALEQRFDALLKMKERALKKSVTEWWEEMFKKYDTEGGDQEHHVDIKKGFELYRDKGDINSGAYVWFITKLFKGSNPTQYDSRHDVKWAAQKDKGSMVENEIKRWTPIPGTVDGHYPKEGKDTGEMHRHLHQGAIHLKQEMKDVLKSSEAEWWKKLFEDSGITHIKLKHAIRHGNIFSHGDE